MVSLVQGRTVSCLFCSSRRIAVVGAELQLSLRLASVRLSLKVLLSLFVVSRRVVSLCCYRLLFKVDR